MSIVKLASKLKIPKNVQLMVFDMAGTTVNEYGLVYKTLYEVIDDFGLPIEKDEIKNWHGANKYEVMNHFYDRFHKQSGFDMETIHRDYGAKTDLYERFENTLFDNYSIPGNIRLISDRLPELFNELREKRQIKIALNTGYSQDLQERIIDKLGMKEFIDDCVSSDMVQSGRPLPHMIHKLMENNDVRNPENVIKFGDTTNDIIEGLTARCLKSVGVLSGAETEKELVKAGATDIIKSVIDIDPEV